MITKFIEATNVEYGGINWGKFLIGRFTPEEWERRSAVDSNPVLACRGWAPDHLLVLDLQTGEGSVFMPGGYAKADLEKHKIWVCPMFEPFLAWLYTQDLSDFENLPSLVDLDAPSAMAGYRRSGVTT